jgi:hypothetical protein
MLTDGDDVCTWCRRSISAFVFPSGVKQTAKAPSKVGPYTKVAVLGVFAALALYVLAHQKFVPDAVTYGNAPGTITNKLAHTGPVLTTKNVNGTAMSPPENSQVSAPMAALASPVNVPSSASQAYSTPTPPPVPAPGIAKLAAVHIETQSDSGNSETAKGTVTIVNQSPYEITDFQLSLRFNGTATPLTAVEANLEYPTPLASKRIPAHGQLQVTVMTPTRYAATEIGARSIVLEAHFEGQTNTSTDSAPLR